MAHAADKTSPKKPKLVRDSFTIPKNEYAAIDALKSRAIALGTSVKKRPERCRLQGGTVGGAHPQDRAPGG
jgi:hypothetical protein